MIFLAAGSLTGFFSIKLYISDQDPSATFPAPLVANGSIAITSPECRIDPWLTLRFGILGGA
ncbi:hypothetical protein J2T59_001452 [Methanosalsum natronophilum]|nr:hypothetical protein [Methanosalsum natronophilum]